MWESPQGVFGAGSRRPQLLTTVSSRVAAAAGATLVVQERTMVAAASTITTLVRVTRGYVMASPSRAPVTE